MHPILLLFILIPLVALSFSLFIPRKRENLLSGIAIAATGLHLAGVLIFTGWWASARFPVLDQKIIVLYQSPEFEFFIDLLFDRFTAVFAGVGSLLAFLVALFSRFYMHRESGFKRFFCTLLLFFSAYNLLVFSGNFETFFVGWEILGVTSFLLIAFYRDRYLPVKNGFKVLSYYRLGDICLILAMWMSHHVWHRNITFAEWADKAAVLELFRLHYPSAMFITGMILLAAVIKSAQFPFSAWLPRAMEGPTTSSAIFYGSLSVHVGVFLLLRTFPFWENEWIIRGVVIAIGVVTSLIAAGIARVQSTVKTQIAYASVAQIGLMFVEVALGLHTLALLHFAGNAFLRTYQLLVSPSVLSYMTHDMLFHFTPRARQTGEGWLYRIRHALYILSVKEFNLDYLWRRYCWNPFKWAGNKLAGIDSRRELALMALLTVAGVVLFIWKNRVEHPFFEVLPLAYSLLSLVTVLKGFSERGDARHTWLLAFASQVFTAFSILFNKDFELHQVVLYLSGSTAAAAVGYYCLSRINRIETDINLNRYHGHSYEHSGMALLFLIACLSMAGFPITPSFIGIDLMFTHVHANQFLMVGVMALNFLFLELTLLRIYNRIFLGQHGKLYHPVAFKSS